MSNNWTDDPEYVEYEVWVTNGRLSEGSGCHRVYTTRMQEWALKEAEHRAPTSETVEVYERGPGKLIWSSKADRKP